MDEKLGHFPVSVTIPVAGVIVTNAVPPCSGASHEGERPHVAGGVPRSGGRLSMIFAAPFSLTTLRTSAGSA